MSLHPKQRRAAELLALGYSPVEAGKRVGANARTLRRWLDDPEFAAAAAADPANISETTPTEVLRSLLSSDRDDMRLRAAQALHLIDQQSNTPDSKGATIFINVRKTADGSGDELAVHDVPEVQRDLPPGSAARLVLHMESAPLPPTSFTPHAVDPVRYGTQADE